MTRERVTLELPAVLADLVGGRRTLGGVDRPSRLSADVLDVVGGVIPHLVRVARRVWQLRRYVNVYADGVDVRAADGTATPSDGCGGAGPAFGRRWLTRAAHASPHLPRAAWSDAAPPRARHSTVGVAGV